MFCHPSADAMKQVLHFRGQDNQILRLFLISSVRLSIILIFSTVTLAAQDSSERKPKKHYIGYGNLITNDLLGDGRNRWRTGSISSSRIWGADWQCELPEEFNELVEI